MSDINVDDILGGMDDAWGDTEPAGGGGMPPDGVYRARVDRFEFTNSKQDGALQLKTELVIESGGYEGSRVSTWHDLQDPERLSWLKGHLLNMGLELERLSELQQSLPAVLDTPVEIRIRTTVKRVNGEERRYTNVYVNKRLGDPPAPATTNERVGTAAPDPDDDLPF